MDKLKDEYREKLNKLHELEFKPQQTVEVQVERAWLEKEIREIEEEIDGQPNLLRVWRGNRY